MTEQEWLTSRDPQVTLDWLGTLLASGTDAKGRPYEVRVSDRKLRLFACACAAQFGLSGLYGREGERIEDPTKLAHEWSRQPEGAGGVSGLYTRSAVADLLRDIIGNPWRPVVLPRNPLCLACGGTGRFVVGSGEDAEAMPCRCCVWITPQTQSLAQAAYDDFPYYGSLDLERLAVLADALEEAGCYSYDLLAHLRGRERCTRCGGAGTVYTGFHDWAGPRRWCDDLQGARLGPVCHNTGWIPLRGPHVRGCWAVDCILGRE